MATAKRARHRDVCPSIPVGSSYHVLFPVKPISRVRCNVQECNRMARWALWTRPLVNGTFYGPFFYQYCGEHKPESFTAPHSHESASRIRWSHDLLVAAKRALYYVPQFPQPRSAHAKSIMPLCPFTDLKAAIEKAEGKRL